MLYYHRNSSGDCFHSSLDYAFPRTVELDVEVDDAWRNVEVLKILDVPFVIFLYHQFNWNFWLNSNYVCDHVILEKHKCID